MVMVDALRSVGVVSGGRGWEMEFGTSGACWGVELGVFCDVSI